MEVEQRRLCKVRRFPDQTPTSNHTIDKAWGRKSQLWAKGTIINWCFVPNTSLDSPQNRQIVIQAWKKWADSGLNLTFKQLEWKDRAKTQIRIAFREFDADGVDEGSYSYVGTDNTGIPKNEHTMNLGWNLSGRGGAGTAEHEIGHALGLDHEHQHPKCLLVWDEEKVIKYFMEGQGWSREDVIEQVIKRVSAPYTGTAWDSRSIMHYDFEPELILSPPEYAKNGVPRNVNITTHDVECILKMYPRVSLGVKPAQNDEPVEPEKPVAAETFPSLEIWKTVKLSLEEDSIYSLVPNKSGQFEIISHGFAEILVVVDVVVAGKKTHLFGGKVNNEKKIPITLISEENVQYILTFRVLETTKTGNFSLLIVEKDN
jgi:hypothetical protein